MPEMNASLAEWDVMRVVWSLNEATSRSVSEVLKESKGWENATTKTLLGRLVKKGYLSTKKVGNRFIYVAEVNETDSVNQRVEDLFASFCDTAVGGAIVAAINDHELSFSDKELILKAIEAKTFSDNVKCTCVGHNHDTCDCEPGNCTCSH